MAYTKTVWLDRAVGWARRFWMNWDGGNDKNLLPPFSDWTLHANAVATATYGLTLTATATFQNSDTPKIPVSPSTSYTLSVTKTGGSAIVIYYDVNSTYITEISNPATFTTPSNAVYVVVRMTNGATATGTFTFTNPQLELGSTATAFTPKKLYTITQSPGTVTQAGTPVNAANLNKMEQGIADAHTPSIVLDLIKQVDGAGSGLDADTLDGRNGLQYAFTQDKLTLSQMQDMNRTSGIYTTTGTGIPNPDGSVFLGGWWHIYHSYHGADGYAVQVAYPYGHEGNSTPYWRNASGTVWSKWRGLGGMTDIQATYTRGAGFGSSVTWTTKPPRVWHTVVDIQNKKGILTHAQFAGHVGTYDQSDNTFSVAGQIQFKLTIDDQVENITTTLTQGGWSGGTGFTFVSDSFTTGGDSNREVTVRPPIYFARNMKLELYADPTQAGYTNNNFNGWAAARYALHIGT